MGADHLGDDKPADTMHTVAAGENYGWPYCYQFGIRRYADDKFNPRGRKRDCHTVPLAYAAFDAHSSPLGFEYFDAANVRQSRLTDSFLVALHGSTKRSLNRGYRVVRIQGSGARTVRAEDFIDGFLRSGKVNGRPVDILSWGPGAFLLTDDYAGAVYYVYQSN